MKPKNVYLFTNRNCLVFDHLGNQMPEYQSDISCYFVNLLVARKLAEEAETFYLSKFNTWCHEIPRRSFEYLLGLRTREMDFEEIEK